MKNEVKGGCIHALAEYLDWSGQVVSIHTYTFKQHARPLACSWVLYLDLCSVITSADCLSAQDICPGAQECQMVPKVMQLPEA